MSRLDGGTIRNFDFDGICSKSFVEDGAREADIGLGAGRIGSKDGGPVEVVVCKLANLWSTASMGSPRS